MSGPRGNVPSWRRPRVVIQGEPRTLRGVDRRLAGIERRLARIIPFDEWVRRQNPTEAEKETYRKVVAGFEAERDRLFALRAALAPAEPGRT